MINNRFFYQDGILHFKINSSQILSFDFLEGNFFHRLQKVEQEILIKKAIGKHSNALKIFDATGGSLVDTFIFLRLGHEVVACEQSKILFMLVKDAVERAKKEYDFLDKLTFLNANSADVINRFSESDIFYFDPMFADTQKKLKRSGVLQKITKVLEIEKLGDTSSCVFSDLREKNYKKIIVKRPIKSEPLHHQINYQVKGKSVRYDVYKKH